MNISKTTEMTTGNPVRHILLFALPLLIGNLFQQFYSLVDSIVVGKFVSADALAAVGACGSMNFLFFSLSSGLSIGIGVIVSQYFGARDEEHVRTAIGNAIYVLGFAAVVVSMLGIIFSPALLRLLKTPEDIIGDSIIYIRTTCAGILAIAVYNGVAAVLRALGDSRTPLYFLILSSIINVTLDLVFVLVFHLGVFGVALATIMAQALSAAASIIYAYQKVPYFHLSKAQWKPVPEIIFKSFRIGIPVALQNSMIAISCMALQGVVNSYGETVMAAFTITGRVEQVVQQPYGSLNMALTTYSGQNMGAGQQARVREGYRKSVWIVLLFSLAMIPFAYLLGEGIAGIFVNETEVIKIAAKALRITSLCYFGLGMIYVPRAVLNGCGDTGFAMINGLTEVACRIVYAQIFTRIAVLGYLSIWITNGFTWVTTAVVCVARYAGGKWRTKAITKRKE